MNYFKRFEILFIIFFVGGLLAQPVISTGKGTKTRTPQKHYVGTVPNTAIIRFKPGIQIMNLIKSDFSNKGIKIGQPLLLPQQSFSGNPLLKSQTLKYSLKLLIN